jgi:hypothetical protein
MSDPGADIRHGWRQGQRAMWHWLYSQGRYDIHAEDVGCVIVLDLRELGREFPEAMNPGEEVYPDHAAAPGDVDQSNSSGGAAVDSRPPSHVPHLRGLKSFC